MKQKGDKQPLFFVNLMLQAFDNYQTHHTISGQHFTQSTYDKSTCSCLRDFASPSLITVSKISPDVQGCKYDDYNYSHSSCSVQSLLDYDIDGYGSVSGGSPSELQNLVVAKIGATPQRNRADPILNHKVRKRVKKKPQLRNHTSIKRGC
jgi:hypothetical protein